MNFIELEHLFIRIPPHKRLYQDVNLSVEMGQSVALMGPSGIGKTTLVHALLGLSPQRVEIQGSLKLLGQELSSMKASQALEFRRRNIGFVFQDPARFLHPFFTIKRLMQIHLVDEFRKEKNERINKGLEDVGLHPSKKLLNSYPHALSGGEQQRVCLALALLNEPKCLIADEPTSSLDFELKAALLKQIQKIQKEKGLSVLLITHSPLIAEKMSTQVYHVHDEKIIKSPYL